MNPKGAFITGADFLIDGGATASYFYGPLKPEEQRKKLSKDNVAIKIKNIVTIAAKY